MPPCVCVCMCVNSWPSLLVTGDSFRFPPTVMMENTRILLSPPQEREGERESEREEGGRLARLCVQLDLCGHLNKEHFYGRTFSIPLIQNEWSMRD